jgi:hypothetical protein
VKGIIVQRLFAKHGWGRVDDLSWQPDEMMAMLCGRRYAFGFTISAALIDIETVSYGGGTVVFEPRALFLDHVELDDIVTSSRRSLYPDF